MVVQIVTKVTRGGLDFTLLSTTNTRHASLLTDLLSSTSFTALWETVHYDFDHFYSWVCYKPKSNKESSFKYKVTNMYNYWYIGIQRVFFLKGGRNDGEILYHVQEETCILYPSDYKSPYWILSCMLKLFPVHQQLTFLLIYWRQSKTMRTERQSTLKRITSFSILLSRSKLLVYFSIVRKNPFLVRTLSTYL